MLIIGGGGEVFFVSLQCFRERLVFHSSIAISKYYNIKDINHLREVVTYM